MSGEAERGRDRLTFWQRMALRGMVKAARKPAGEPLGPEDWAAFWEFESQPTSRVIKRIWRTLPSSPRCGYCGAPFAGIGALVVRPLGYRPSRKNPNICDTCIEMMPPGGMTLEAGVLFADIRGFTNLSERTDPEQASRLLRRFYAVAEKVLFPEALLDKVIGDEVMALYVPPFLFPHEHAPGDRDLGDEQRARVAVLMLEHARELLGRLGYGTPDGPFAEVGIGLDFGDLFLGNIGEATVKDFTAIGDVVNTAARLQGHAAGGEIVLSRRLGRHLDPPVGAPEDLVVKGKEEPVSVFRIRLSSV